MENTVAQSAATVQSTSSPSHTPNTQGSPSPDTISNGSTKALSTEQPMEVQCDAATTNHEPTTSNTSKKPEQSLSAVNSPKSSPAKSRSRSRSKKSTQPQIDITIDDSKVEVSGYPAYVKAQDLYKIFSSYGPLQVEHMGRRCAVISFERVESARAAIDDSMQLCLYSQFLVIKPFTGIVDDRKQIYKSKHAVETVAPENIPLTGTFSTQVASLLAAVRLTQEQVTALATLYYDLERVLQPVWPGCQAMPFGSITTGLGVKSSDADCFVNIPPQYRYNYYNYVNKAKRILLMYPETFTEVFAIPRANTPIVKLFHLPTRTHCDLTFKTPLGALNSKLVAFLLHADPRFLPLAVLVKYWASVQGISGSGKLTNYALTLMLVFYLQARGLLPSVAALQRDVAPMVVDGWNTAFAEKHRIPRCANDEALHDLFGGFFKFYDTFDFENLVACPYLGRPVDKNLFFSGDLPHEFHRYRKNVAENMVAPLRIKVSVCVQDPFEQCHNVASSVSPRMFEDMRVYIRFAAEHYEKDRPNACENLLRNILLDKPKLVRAKTNPEYRVTLYPKMLGTIVHDDWKGAFRRAVLTVFERMLKLPLKLIPEQEVPRHNARERERYVTSMGKPVWKRKQFSRMYESIQMGFIEKQEQITEDILNSDMNVGVIEFQVILSFCTKMRSAWVCIRVTNGDVDEFHNFGKYFIGTMQSWMIRVIHASGDTSGKDDVNRLRALNTADGLSDPDSDSDSTDNKEDKPHVEPQSALTSALQVPTTDEPSNTPEEIPTPQEEVQPTASDC